MKLSSDKKILNKNPKCRTENVWRKRSLNKLTFLKLYRKMFTAGGKKKVLMWTLFQSCLAVSLVNSQ